MPARKNSKVFLPCGGNPCDCRAPDKNNTTFVQEIIRQIAEFSLEAIDKPVPEIRVDDSAAKPHRQVFRQSAAGRVVFVMPGRAVGDVRIELDRKYKITAPLRQAVKAVNGVIDVLDI